MYRKVGPLPPRSLAEKPHLQPISCPPQKAPPPDARIVKLRQFEDKLANLQHSIKVRGGLGRY